MTKQTAYNINLDVAFKPLELIDLSVLIGACKDKWYNQTLTQVNDSVVRLGILDGEFHWHKHDNEDEFFYVVDGLLIIDLEDRSVELKNLQGFTVPKGIVHRTRASQKTVVLMVEAATVTPVGDQ